MTELRILNAVVWASMFFYMIPGAWAACTGCGVRYGDPMRLACLLVAIVICGFNLRYFVAPFNVPSQAGLYILSSVVGVFIVLLARAYGRGHRA